MSTDPTKRKKYYCACSRLCKRKKLVSKSTYHRHKAYRDPESTRLPSIGSSMRGRRNIVYILAMLSLIFEACVLRKKPSPVVALPIPASVEGEPTAAQSPGADTGPSGRSLPGDAVCNK
jgi:hypothetical protein